MTTATGLSQMVLEGRYQPGSSLLHRLSPSLKIGIAFLFLLLATWGDLKILSGLMVICLLAMALARIPLSTVAKFVYAFRWLFLFIGLIPLVTTPGAAIEVLKFLPFQVSWEGLWLGSESFLKLLVMFFLSLLLVRTTAPQALMNTLQKAIIIKNPAWKKTIQEFFMTGLWAVQLLPMICVETEAFMLTRLNQAEESKKSGIKKAWSTASQLGPLMAHLLGQMNEWERELTGNQNWDDWRPEVT